MPLTLDDIPVIRKAVADELNRQAQLVKGISSFERYLEVLLDAARKADNNVIIALTPKLNEILVAAQTDPTIDVAALAAALAPLLTPLIPGLSDADLTAIRGVVDSELDRRNISLQA